MKYLLINSLFSGGLNGSQHEMRWHFLKALESQALSLGAELLIVNETLKNLNSTNAILLTAMAGKKPLFIANPNGTTSEHINLMSTLSCFKKPSDVSWANSTDDSTPIVLHSDKITNKNKSTLYIDVTKSLPCVFREDGLCTILIDTEKKSFTTQLLDLESLDLTSMPLLQKTTEWDSTLSSLKRESLFSNLLKKNQDMLKENSVKDDENEITSNIDKLQNSGEFSESTGNYLKGLLQESLTVPSV